MAEKKNRKRYLEKRMKRKARKEAVKASKLEKKKKTDARKERTVSKPIRKKDEKKISAQKTIAYKEMARDGICRVKDQCYSKTIRFSDINYQLAQNEDKTAIFENWCDFLNYFDSR